MAGSGNYDLRVGWVSTYPPRACGIGTFTRDLAAAAAALPRPVGAVVAAINGPGETYAYDPLVRVQLKEGAPRATSRRPTSSTGCAAWTWSACSTTSASSAAGATASRRTTCCPCSTPFGCRRW